MDANNVAQVSRAQKISTVVDIKPFYLSAIVSRAQKISTVVDTIPKQRVHMFHALKKFLLL